MPRHPVTPNHRGAVGDMPNPDLTSFNTFLQNLPPALNQCGLEKVFSGMKKNEKESLAIVDRLLRCLQSQKQQTQHDSFITLVILLSTSNHIRTERVLESINQIFVTDGDNTRGERRAVYAAHILGLGALVRSKRVFSVNHNVLNQILEQLASLGEKRTSLLTLAIPFICEVLSGIKKKHQKRLELHPVQNLLLLSSKPQLASVLKLSLSIIELGLQLDSPLTASMDSICSTVVGFVRHGDKACLRLLFRYLIGTKQTKAFWKLFPAQLGPYHFELLQGAILVALESHCPLKDLLRKNVLQPLAGLLRSGEQEMTKKVLNIFRLLLDWGPTSKLKRKTRLSAIRLLFEDLQLNSEYRTLHAVFRRFLTFLNPEELELLFTVCRDQTNVVSRGGNSTLTFLSRLPPLKNTGVDMKLSIVKELFAGGFCLDVIPGASADVPPEILTMRKRISREGYVSILKTTFETEFIQRLFAYVKGVAAGKKELTLEKPVSEEDLTNFKIITKLLRKMEDEDLANCLRIYGLYCVVDSHTSTAGLDSLIPLCEKTVSISRTERAPMIVSFLLSAIRQEHVIFDYEAIFGKLLLEKVVTADSVELLIELIDVEGVDHEEDSSDNDESGAEDEEELALMGPEQRSNGFEHPAGRMDQDTEIDNSDQESLDMDNLSDGELEKMDAALSNVFSTKKKVKEERRMEETLTLRSLNLLGMLLRRYSSPEDGSIPLLLVTPALTLLRKSAKAKKLEVHSRISDVVRRLNRIRRIGNADSFERSLIQNAKTDIEEMLNKKLPKTVRVLVRGTLEMLEKCFKTQLEEHEERSAKRRGEKSEKGLTAKKPRTS